MENILMGLVKVKNVLDITADTVADLANVQHKTGSIQLLGFHTKGDGGGGVFYWDATKDKSEHNGGTIIDPNKAGLVANWASTQALYFTPAVVGQGCWVREYSGAVNVKWFGAKGDGVADDTNAIQETLNISYAIKNSVSIPTGVYPHGGLLVKAPQEASYYDRPKTIITGSGIGNTELVHIGTGSAMEVVGENDTSNSTFGVVLRDFSIRKNITNPTDTTNGIKLQKGTGYLLDNLYIEGGINSIYMSGEVWLSKFTNLKLSGNPMYGINMVASGTSNYFDQCYVTYSTVSAYRLKGSYSVIGTLAADNCSGGSVYDFDYFSGGVNSLGCENADVDVVLSSRNNTLSVQHITIFNPVVSDVKGKPIHCQSGLLEVACLNIFDTTGGTASQQLFSQLDGSVKINAIKTDWEFTEQLGSSSDNNGFAVYSDKNSPVALRQAGARAYLGLDRKGQNRATIDAAEIVHSNAIFLDSLGAPRYTSDGTDRRYQVGATNGDWFIEGDPSTNLVAGYVATVTSSDLSSVNPKAIPLLLKGTTLDRPTVPAGSLRIGLSYFDTTLNKPIWWNGSDWVDATGTTV
jgi:hypothetical protein